MSLERQIVDDLHECMDWAEGGPDGDHGAAVLVRRLDAAYVASARRPEVHGVAGELVWQPGESVADALANLAGRVVELHEAEQARQEAA